VGRHLRVDRGQATSGGVYDTASVGGSHYIRLRPTGDHNGVSTMHEDVWRNYDEWNASVAASLFGPDKAEMPAYVDTDPEHLADWAAPLGIAADSARDALIAAVRPTLGLETGDQPLARHTQRFAAWRAGLVADERQRSRGARRRLEPPPIVALLATCVLAAERMGADTTLAPNAYYPRLAETLDLKKLESDRLQHAFPVTERYWRGLNEYLESLEGSLGLPTAYALGHRYVGIPQSQALVRAGDRAKLREFFRRFGLAPGSELVPADLEGMLDSWISGSPSPVSANLQRLWRRPAVRERVAGVAAVELALWDGTLPKHVGEIRAGDSEVKLLALLRQRFGGRSLELSFAARFASMVEASSLRVLSAAGTPSVSVMPAPGSRLRPEGGTNLDAASLVGAVVQFENPVSGEVAIRQPRRVVPLRRDELLGSLVEIDRVQLADDCLLLIKDELELVSGVLAVVKKFGHAGRLYSTTETKDRAAMPGLPDGWVLLEDVQMYGVPQDVKRMDLHCLIPLTSAQLVLAGGLKMPGNIRRWSRLRPPELRAVAEGAGQVRVTLSELGVDRTLLEDWTEEGSVLVRSLSELNLADGNYEIQMFPNGASDAIASSTLRIRSADTPDLVSWETCTRLNYQLESGALAALSASPADDESVRVVDGLLAIGELIAEVPELATPKGAPWATAKSARTDVRPSIVLGAPDLKSCVLTGAHRIELPLWLGGKSNGPLKGVCSTCGLTKTYPSTPRWKSTVAQPRNPVQHIAFQDLPSHTDLGATWDECLDALVHVGGGTIGALERVAVQAESSSLFVDDFVRTLEALGHIDVRRDDSLQPVEWEANPAFLAETCDGSFVLAGVWSPSTRSTLTAALEGSGGDLTTIESERGPVTRLVRGVSGDQLRGIVESVGISAYVVPDAVNRMLGVLPTLSSVELELAHGPIPNYSKATVFNLETASWMTVPGVGAPGAYRLEQSFRRISVWVDSDGAINRTARFGSVQLVKHIAALHSRRPLTGYLDGQSMLVVPIGADLPGLYGRIATLCSGRPAQVSPRTRTLGYPGVPPEVANRITSLLQA